MPTEPAIVQGELDMLRVAIVFIVFLVVALLSAFLGFGGVETYSWTGAKILFFIFLVLAVLWYLGGTYYRRRMY